MTLLEEKNLQKGEVVIYKPRLHWIVLVRPIVYLFISVILLIIIKLMAPSSLSGIYGFLGVVNNYFKIIMTINVILALLYLGRRIIEYCVAEYYVTNKRLILKKGLFASRLIDIPIEKVESLICVKGLFGYLFNYGTVFVSGLGGTLSRYSNVKKPYKVRRVIYDVMDKSKSITIIREDLPKPVIVKEVRKERRPEIQYGVFVTSYPAGKREVLTK
jgi:hypothetical protein